MLVAGLRLPTLGCCVVTGRKCGVVLRLAEEARESGGMRTSEIFSLHSPRVFQSSAVVPRRWMN